LNVIQRRKALFFLTRLQL